MKNGEKFCKIRSILGSSAQDGCARMPFVLCIFLQGPEGFDTTDLQEARVLLEALE